MKGLLKRITENTEIFSKINFPQLRHSTSPLPPFSRDPSHPFYLLRGAPFPGVLFPLLLKIKPKYQTKLPILRSQDSPAIHRPSGLRLERGNPERREEERGGDAVTGVAAVAAAAAASTAASAWCILLPPRRRPHGLAHTAPLPERSHSSPPSSPGPLPHEGTSAEGDAAGDRRSGAAGAGGHGRRLREGEGTERSKGRAETTALRLLRPRRPRLSTPARGPARRGTGNAAASALLTFNSNCHRRRLPSPPIPPLPRPGPAVAPTTAPLAAASSSPQGVPQLGPAAARLPGIPSR